MRVERRIRLLVSASAGLLLAARLPAQSRIPLTFRDSAATWLAAAHVPALAIAVIDGGKVSSIQTFGELHPGVPMSPRALFNVASLTKPIVAVTTLRLASAGKLDLNAPRDPDWIDPDIRGDPRHSKLTARIVLSHQTGFPNWRSRAPHGKLAFLFDPGTKFGYSGEGFEYLRHALEHRYGRSLQQLSDSILFRPLQMTETTFGWNPRENVSRFAVGHDASGAPISQRMRTMDRPNAADWLVTTIGDYSKFGVYVLHGAGLARPVFADMTKPQVQFEGKSGEAMGLGWEVMAGPTEDPVILMHTGSDAGIKTMILLLPTSQRGLVIFTNGERGMDVVMKLLRSTLHLKELTP
jgi:CubicO group peptidase (beta-lactamase class C family)